LFEKGAKTLLLGGSKDGKITIRVLHVGDSVQLFTSKAHKKDVSAVSWGRNGTFFTGGVDGKVKIFVCTDGGKALGWKEVGGCTVEGGVRGISVHPSGDYFAAVGERVWFLCESDSGAIVATVESGSDDAGFTSICFHPDGLILATGCTDGSIQIWDLKTQKSVSTFTGHEGDITSLSFSQNGYYLASAGDFTVRVWDLRYQSQAVSLTVPESGGQVSWDAFGAYLGACCGSSVIVYANKKWGIVGEFEIETKGCGIGFGGDAGCVVVAGSDGKYGILKNW